MDVVLYSLIPFAIFIIIFGVYSFYTKIKNIKEELEIIKKNTNTSVQQIIENQGRLFSDLDEKIRNGNTAIDKIYTKLEENQNYNIERFKYILTDTKQISQRLEEYRRQIFEAQALNPKIENDISKQTDEGLDLSDGVTPFPMHDNLKVQIDDGSPMPITISRDIPDDSTLPS